MLAEFSDRGGAVRLGAAQRLVKEACAARRHEDPEGEEQRTDFGFEAVRVPWILAAELRWFDVGAPPRSCGNDVREILSRLG